ncbi:MAG: phosphate ABC transporter substrate-binding protein, partial [Bacteroidales bacterium]
MRRIFLILFSATLLFVSCNRQAKSYPDTPTSGVITISADETFAPVLDQEIDIFEFQYPEAHIIPIYT